MADDKQRVLAALKRIKGPDLEGNIVDLGLVSEVLIKDGRVYFSITVPAERAAELEPLREAAQKVVRELDGIKGVTAVLTAEAQRGAGTLRQSGAPESARVQAARAGGTAGDGGGHQHGHQHGHAAGAAKPQGGTRGSVVPGIRHLIAVASGKGGVGKSTTAVNLALALKANGLEVGVLDADVYGPSQPKLLGLSGRPETVQGGRALKPLIGYGLKVMSMGFLVDEATPVVWRGPMVVGALGQMLREVAWSFDGRELDVLVIDMPPGTGDIQLSMAQQAPLSGAIIVSTPQDLALIDARKGLNMFRQVNVPVLGIIENMSYFICPKCGERSDIFGHGGAEHEAETLGLPFLGAVPLHIDIRVRSDAGQPIVATQPAGVHARIFREIAARAWSEVALQQGQRAAAPDLALSAGGDRLDVRFASGEQHELSAEMLRVMSPSAEVQGHSPEQRVTVARKRNVRIKELRPVGNYAVRIAFDDGHDTGLYAWSYLSLLGREKEKRWSEYLAELKAKGLERG
jgi:ATP-binding protein involved in chromosome partitioning